MTMIDMAQNLNALGPPPHSKELLLASAEALFEYPDSKDEETRHIVAKWMGVPEESVATGNGTTELIYSLPDVLKRQRNIIVSPTFWQYYKTFERSERWDIEKFVLDAEDFSFDPERLQIQLETGSPNATVFLCNPNNPTSTLVQKDTLWDLIKRHKETFFVIDETYLLFSEEYDKQSLAQIAAHTKNLAVLTSLSKFYHLPGIRVGVMVSHSDNIKDFLDKKIPYMANPIVPIVLQELIGNKEFINQTRSFYREQVQKLFDLLTQNFGGRLQVFQPETIFILIRILTEQTSDEICDILMKNGIMVRSGSQLPGMGKEWLRIAAAHDEYQSKLIAALHQGIKSLTQ